MNLTRRGWFGSIIALAAGFFSVAKHNAAAAVPASTPKPRNPAWLEGYPRVTTFEYDANGTLKAIYGDGPVTTFTYDGIGRITSVCHSPTS